MTNLELIDCRKLLKIKEFGCPPPGGGTPDCHRFRTEERRPAGRAHCAWSGHFVTCIPPSGLAPVGRLEESHRPRWQPDRREEINSASATSLVHLTDARQSPSAVPASTRNTTSRACPHHRSASAQG